MKSSNDEDEYGSFYTQRSSNGARYNRYRDYSPNRGHHQSASSNSAGISSSSSRSVGNMGEPSPYNVPNTRSYNRTPPYGTTSRNMVEYGIQPPPCCGHLSSNQFQFYQAPPPPIPLHPSPSHFNTIPHPPLQYRDVPACATLNRSCYSRRGNYPTYGYASESPYGDPRSDIYYTSTLTRHSRHGGGGNNTNRSLGPSSSYHSDTSENKIYESPSQTYHGSSSSSGGGGGGSSSNRTTYGTIGSSTTNSAGIIVGGGRDSVTVGIGGMSERERDRDRDRERDRERERERERDRDRDRTGGSSQSQNSLLRLEEPRLYSSSTAQLGSTLSNQSASSLQRSNSPQHFIDRSISLIRLDNSNNMSSSSGVGVGMGSQTSGSSQRIIPQGQLQEASGGLGSGASLNPGNSQPRLDRFKIKFTADLTSQQQQQQQSQSSNPMSSTLTKTIVELGSDPLSGAKPKYKPPVIEVPPKPPVEMSDKAVMTSSLPEQWSVVSSGSGHGSDGRRISIGGTMSPLRSSPPASTLAGGVPDLLPSCVVRQNEFTTNHWRNSGNLPSPRRSCYLNSGSGGGGGNSSQNPGSSRGGSKSNGSGSSPYLRKTSKWDIIRKYVRTETKTFFGLEGGESLKEEWLSRRKRFASRRYSERNVQSGVPPSPYRNIPPPVYDQADGHGRIPSSIDHRSTDSSRGTNHRIIRKKEHVMIIYWNLIRWFFWSLRFGPAGQRVAAGAGCGSDTSPGSGGITPGRVPLNSQMARDRTKSRSISPNTLTEIPPSVTISPQELLFDDLDDNHRNSTLHLQPPGRGLQWRVASRPYSASNGFLASTRISPQFLSKVLDNSERQQYRRSRPPGGNSKLAVIEEYRDFRPYFTYWVTIVQCIILITTMISYGIAPVGLDLHRKSSLVLVTSLSLQQMEIIQPANFWIGPSAADLIHLGAKFAPCMRRDDEVHRRILETRDRERQTACCIRNDNSGCVQSSRNECSVKGVSRSGLLSSWKKWTGDGGGRISGSVCGLDPMYCKAPASIAPYEWPDDITKWPICRKTRASSGIATKDKTAEHMVCEVIGHPCCIGIHAKCLITTREYCRFVNGYFHEEASLCSQVSCLQDVCGMFPFLGYEQPDQFYRLISSLFLHAGLGHFFFTLLFNWFIMRDLEKLAGPLRIAIIYLGSGITGNLVSVLLEPHRAEVGPGGAQYGLIACQVVELSHIWRMLRRPWQALGKIMLVTTVFFLLGFLPWIDNFAHIMGFIVGFFLSHAVMPYVSFGKYSSYRKWMEIVLCLGFFFIMLIVLLFIFYAGYGDCEWCRHLNCLSLTVDFCADQDIDFKPSGGGYNLT